MLNLNLSSAVEVQLPTPKKFGKRTSFMSGKPSLKCGKRRIAFNPEAMKSVFGEDTKEEKTLSIKIVKVDGKEYILFSADGSGVTVQVKNKYFANISLYNKMEQLFGTKDTKPYVDLVKNATGEVYVLVSNDTEETPVVRKRSEKKKPEDAPKEPETVAVEPKAERPTAPKDAIEDVAFEETASANAPAVSIDDF